MQANKPKKKPISVAARKQKARLLQQHVRDTILKTFPNLTEDDCHSTSMGAGGVDVMLSSVAKRLFPFAVECKAKQSVNIYEAMEQAQANRGAETPLVVIKKNRGKAIAVLDFEDFMQLVAKKWF